MAADVPILLTFQLFTMLVLVISVLFCFCSALPQQLCGENLLPCGNACYSSSKVCLLEDDLLKHI